MGKRYYLTEEQFRLMINEAQRQELLETIGGGKDWDDIISKGVAALKKGFQLAAIVGILGTYYHLSPPDKQRVQDELEKEEYAIEHSGIYNHNGEEMKDYDKTLPGQLINYSENRDSVGYDKNSERWYAPPKGKKYDRKQRGMGVDVNTNPFVNKYLKVDKKGAYLTKDDEKKVRYMSIERAEKCYERRLAYVRKVFNDYETEPSEVKKALTMSAIYNLGEGYAARKLFEDKNLMNLFLYGTDDEYRAALDAHYKVKRKGQRSAREQEFLDAQYDKYYE